MRRVGCGVWDAQVYSVNQSLLHKKHTLCDRSAAASSPCIQNRFLGGRNPRESNVESKAESGRS